MTAAVTDDPPIIEVRNVVKEYRLGALEGLRTLGRRLLGQAVPERQRFRALNDVSFSVKRGEVVGIIGHNGAGKSTLLKLLCNITTPTSGSVTVRGRISPLIEVSAGLIGDMTGRENIYLNASILGLTHEQIDGKVDEIIAFAELEKFCDTPIKRYSSGMQVRLAFSIAIAVDAPVLIIDEVLAVGDVAFQRKCFTRMTELLRNSQRTVLIVGHNIRQIQRIATRMILLDGGVAVQDGACAVVARAYYDQMDRKLQLGRSLSGAIVESTGEIAIDQIDLEGAGGEVVDRIPMFADLIININFSVNLPVSEVEVAIGILSGDQVPVCMQSSGRARLFTFAVGKHTLRARFKSLPVLPGEFSVIIHFQDTLGTNLLSAENAARFQVYSSESDRVDLSSTSLIQVHTDWELSCAASG